MEKVYIEATKRLKVGKEISKKERRKDFVPAIIYGKGVNIPIVLPQKSLKILKSINLSKSVIIDIKLNSSENETDTISALIKDVQYHPLTENIIHIDFVKVSLTEKIKVKVPIVLKGEAKGIKDGGIVQQILWNIELEGLPQDIPEKIEVDVTELLIGHSIHVSNLKISENLKVITSQDATIVTVVEKTEEVAATPTEGAPEGPEVIKEKKAEEEPKEEKEETKEKQEEKKETKGKEK